MILYRGFIDSFGRRTTGFHRQTKLFELTSLYEKLSARWSNQSGKIILTAGQFAQCPALNETPVL